MLMLRCDGDLWSCLECSFSSLCLGSGRKALTMIFGNVEGAARGCVVTEKRMRSDSF